MSLRFWLSRYSSTFVITLEALFTMKTSAPRLKIFSATYPLIPFTNVTTAISADTAMTTPSSVRTERSLFAHRDCRAMRIASDVFINPAINVCLFESSRAASVAISRPSPLGIRTCTLRRLETSIIGELGAGSDGRSCLVYAGFAQAARERERKVRTPQSSVPDNVREERFKALRRKVPQRIYRRVLARASR